LCCFTTFTVPGGHADVALLFFNCCGYGKLLSTAAASHDLLDCITNMLDHAAAAAAAAYNAHCMHGPCLHQHYRFFSTQVEHGACCRFVLIPR
jgi:hypothetical protein